MECVGHADRSAYDLSKHSTATNVKLVAEHKLAEPKTVQVWSNFILILLETFHEATCEWEWYASFQNIFASFYMLVLASILIWCAWVPVGND